MNCTNNWDKCTDVINRLSSRIKNEQNEPTIMPSCIEKSFYQCKSNIGRECCVEVCGDCSDPIKISDGCMTNNNWEKSIGHTMINQQFQNTVNLNRHQFTLSKMFDNKRKYIDYVVTNVLRQVVNHMSLESLHQISCCLPQHIEKILRDVTDIDSDRLVRLLVTEVLQSYGTNAGQVTDWYAFANSIQPRLPPSTAMNNDKKKENDTGNKVSSKLKKLPKEKKKKTSDRILSNHVKSIFTTTPVSSLADKKQSSESITLSKITSPSTDSTIPSIQRTPSTGITPQIMSTKNSMTPMSTYSKETYTPIGTKYQSKTKPNQNVVFDKSNEVDYHESVPFRENSANRSSSNKQHQISTDAHYYDHKSNKSSDRSSSSDCVLTIHHKHRHKRGSHHHLHHRHKHHTTTSFDTPSSRSLSSHTSVPINEHKQKYKQMSIDTSPIVTDAAPTRIKSRENISFNSINTEQLKTSDLFTDEQILLFKLLASSDNAVKHLHQTENPSFQLPLHDAQISSADNEHPILDNHQSLSSNDLSKFTLSASENRVEPHINSIPPGKKILRINHYPNMLADFD